jgi:hypothetical protein
MFVIFPNPIPEFQYKGQVVGEVIPKLYGSLIWLLTFNFIFLIFKIKEPMA